MTRLLKTLVLTAGGVAGLLAAGLAHAGSNVYWSVGVALPGVPVVGSVSNMPPVVSPAYVVPAPVVVAPPVHVVRPVVVVPRQVVYAPAPYAYAGYGAYGGHPAHRAYVPAHAPKHWNRGRGHGHDRRGHDRHGD